MGIDTSGTGTGALTPAPRGKIEEDKKLVFSYENLMQFPIPNLLEQNGVSDLEILDLSHNSLSDVNFLVHFPKLTTLIMDHNLLTSELILPTVSKSLTTLWINHNQIDKLYPFVQRVKRAFPNLKYLSLMGNAGAPSYLNGGTYYEYLQYRLFVISQLTHLVCLDDLHVTPHQKQEARRLFSRSYIQRLINLPFPQYLHHVQQRVKIYIRNEYPNNSSNSRRESAGSVGSRISNNDSNNAHNLIV